MNGGKPKTTTTRRRESKWIIIGVSNIHRDRYKIEDALPYRYI
jgi:hypothetical protein